MQAAGIGGGGGHAGLAALHQQHVRALPREVHRGRQPDGTAADHQHIAGTSAAAAAWRPRQES